jgi:hypothetical protein
MCSRSRARAKVCSCNWLMDGCLVFLRAGNLSNNWLFREHFTAKVYINTGNLTDV